MTVSLRKATYSYGNIQLRQAYTVNVPSIGQIREADYAGIASGRDVDKFERTRMTAVRSELVDAPYVAEFPVIMECRVVHTADLGLHTMFVGEVMDVKVEDSLLGENDRPVIEKLELFVYTGEYYAVGGSVGKAYTVGKVFE